MIPMKKIFVMFLFAAFIFTGVSFAQTTPPAAPAAASAKPEVAAHHEHHPELHKAMRKLKAAKEDLQKAEHDYGGHRVKAIEAIDHAIQELKEALETDKK
jgi:hypothetical protein